VGAGDAERYGALNHKGASNEETFVSATVMALTAFSGIIASAQTRMDQTTGLRREMSIRDVGQRASHIAARFADEDVPASNGDRSANMHNWKDLRDSEYALQIERHGVYSRRHDHGFESESIVVSS
jgi:hypothetical protein